MGFKDLPGSKNSNHSQSTKSSAAVEASKELAPNIQADKKNKSK